MRSSNQFPFLSLQYRMSCLLACEIKYVWKISCSYKWKFSTFKCFVASLSWNRNKYCDSLLLFSSKTTTGRKVESRCEADCSIITWHRWSKTGNYWGSVMLRKPGIQITALIMCVLMNELVMYEVQISFGEESAVCLPRL